MMLSMLAAAAVVFLDSSYRPLPVEKPVSVAESPTVEVDCKGGKGLAGKKISGSTKSQGVANLPFAMGHRFNSLDQYLTHLQCVAAPIDLPWWREIRPGIYEHVKTATGAKPQIATREELMERFGFTD